METLDLLALNARRSNQSIVKEISPEYSLQGLMLKLKLQYFGHLMQRTDSSEKTLTLGKTESRRRRGWQKMRWLDGIINSIDTFEQAPGDSDGQGSLACCSPWSRKESDTTEKLNWTELNWTSWTRDSEAATCRIYPWLEKVYLFNPRTQQKASYHMQLGIHTPSDTKPQA